jgi:hypothetical protein
MGAAVAARELPTTKDIPAQWKQPLCVLADHVPEPAFDTRPILLAPPSAASASTWSVPSGQFLDY